MAVFAQTDQSDRVWLYHLERWHCHFSHQMSSNGLESLGDMGPGTTECRNSINVSLSNLVSVLTPVSFLLSRPIQCTMHTGSSGHAHPCQRRPSLCGDAVHRAVGKPQQPGTVAHAVLGSCVRAHGRLQQQCHEGQTGQSAGLHPQQS